MFPLLHLDHIYYNSHLKLESISVHRSRLALAASAAMVFAGTARYRAPWDFLLALLAAFALAEIWERVRTRRGYAAAASRAR